MTAGLRLSAVELPAARTVTLGSGSAAGVDAALRDLLTELLSPIEVRLVRIESEIAHLSSTVGVVVRNRRSLSQAWRQTLRPVRSRVRKRCRRLLPRCLIAFRRAKGAA